jgi:CBS domain-containing protein
MLARDVMTTTVATVSPDTPVLEIAALLLERHISGVPVVDADGHVLGIVARAFTRRQADQVTPVHREHIQPALCPPVGPGFRRDSALGV